MKPVVGHWSLHRVPRRRGAQPRTEGGLFAASVAAVSVANPVLSLPLGAFAVASLGAVISASIEETSDAEKTAWKAESATGQPSLA
jgi:predicted solute-binding protein